jgi:hypothetical protein
MGVFAIERKEVVLMALAETDAENRRATRGLTAIETEAASETALVAAEIKRFTLTTWEPFRNKEGCKTAWTVAPPKSKDAERVAKIEGGPMFKEVTAVDALKTRLLDGEPAVKGKLARSMETSVVPS